MKTMSLGMALLLIILAFVGGIFVGYRLPERGEPLIASLIDAGEKATSTPQKEILPPGEPAKVIKVLDGDTILIEGGEQVRYIGIDAPENTLENTSVCYANESKEANKKLVEGKIVRLIRDTNNRDPLNRLLRYVYVETADGAVMVNERLVKEGAAKATPYPPDVKFATRFATIETEAKMKKTGLWAVCGNEENSK
ncbi:MAG: thermonuclease family protein [Nanoarchaeota archaeon]|nr:thermonuclease family protein [Nanoarchaeota archaeon]